MRAEDLRVREMLERDGRLLRGYDADMEAVHRRNAARLREVVDAHGWPGHALAGEDGAEAAWLVAQHAIGEPDFQRACLGWLQAAAARGDVPGWQPACLLDRIRVFEGWPQVYGTQCVTDGRPYPIADEPHVDDRRRGVGLSPLQRGPAAVRERPPGPDESARQREMHEWARRVGWRPRILHLARGEDWDAARATGAYTADSLSSEGFIHCSEPQQVIAVANARFRGRRDLVMLQVAVARLTAPLQYENLEGGDDLFPHVYGPLNIDAIVAATVFLPDGGGAFDRDQLAQLY